MAGRVSIPLEERFWEKVDVQGEDDCWEWQASRVKGGYGDFSMGRARRHIRAHHIAYFLHYGYMPPRGKHQGDNTVCVLHECDNPPCCNPKHLSIGTHIENMAQMMERDRSTRGTRNSQSKLTDADVDDIRQSRAAGVLLRVLAEQYGVRESAISRIANGVRWGWK